LIEGDYKGALLTYGDAFDNTKFNTSPNGRALYGFLLWQNGLRLQGLETLLAVESPKDVADYLMNLWQPLVKADALEWRVVERDVPTEWAVRLNMPTQKADAEKWRAALQMGVAGQADK